MESIVDRQHFAHDDTFLIRHIENDFKMLIKKPILAIEAKETEQNIPSALQYFCKTYKCPGIVLTKNLTQLDFKNNFIICGFDRFARAYL
jgi:hypothetical protein